VLLAVVGLMASLVMDARVRAYEKNTPRDPETGIMEGAAPRILGPATADKAILFIHGFIGTPNNFNDLPDKVAEAGWHTEVMLLPGHGTTPHEFELTTAEDIIAGVVDRAITLNKNYDTFVILGHSMGGALATIAAGEVRPDGLILVAPYYGLTARPALDSALAVVARVLAPVLRWIPGRPDGAPVALEENRLKVVDYNWVPSSGTVAAMTIRARAITPGLLESITCPTLLLHSKNDSVTNWKASATALERIPAELKSVHWYEDSDHVLFWDHDREAVKQATLDFLQSL
jgi:carboxylesterase